MKKYGEYWSFVLMSIDIIEYYYKLELLAKHNTFCDRILWSRIVSYIYFIYL